MGKYGELFNIALEGLNGIAETIDMARRGDLVGLVRQARHDYEQCKILDAEIEALKAEQKNLEDPNYVFMKYGPFSD